MTAFLQDTVNNKKWFGQVLARYPSEENSLSNDELV